MKTYRTQENDMLDAICWKTYGRLDVLWQVLEANPGLADLGEKYPSGLEIRLPEFTPAAESEIRLWD